MKINIPTQVAQESASESNPACSLPAVRLGVRKGRINRLILSFEFLKAFINEFLIISLLISTSMCFDRFSFCSFYPSPYHSVCTDQTGYINVLDTFLCGSDIVHDVVSTYNSDVLSSNGWDILCSCSSLVTLPINYGNFSQYGPGFVANVAGDLAFCTTLNSLYGSFCGGAALCYCKDGYHSATPYCHDNTEFYHKSLVDSSIGIYYSDTFSNIIERDIPMPIQIASVNFIDNSMVIKFVYSSDMLLYLVTPLGNYQARSWGPTVQIDLKHDLLDFDFKWILHVISGTQSETKQGYHHSKPYCEYKPCLICSAAYHNWDCLTTSERFGLISFTILFSFLSLVTLCFISIVLLYITYRLIKYIYCKSKSLYKKMMEKRRLKKTPNNFSDLDNTYKSTPLKVQSDSEYYSSLKKITIPTRTIVALALLIPFVVAQCDQGLTSTALIQSCHLNLDNTETCITSSQIDLSLPSPGTTACIAVIPSSSDSIVSGISIEYVSFISSYSYSPMWYTSDYDVGSIQNVHCNKAPMGGSNAKCSEESCNYINQFPLDKTAGGDLDASFLLRYPGESGCTRAYGDNHCLHFNEPGCMVSAWVLKSKGSVWSINSVGLPSFIVNLLITVNGQQDNVYLSLGSSATYQGYTISFNLAGDTSECGAFDEGVALVNEVGTDNYYIASEAILGFPGSPDRHKLSNFQSSSPTVFSEPDQNSILIDYSTCSINNVVTLDSQIYYACDATALTNCFHNMSYCSELPHVYNYGFVAADASGLYRQCFVAPSILVSVSSSNVVFTRETDSCSVEFGDYIVSGCFGCSTCASISVHLEVPDGDCNFIVSSLDVLVNTVSLMTDGSGYYSISFCSSSRSVEASMCLNDYCFDFTAYLDPPIIINPDNSFTYVYAEDLSSDIVDAFFDMADANTGSNWWIWLIFVVSFIILCILCLGCIYACFSCYSYASIFKKVTSKLV